MVNRLNDDRCSVTWCRVTGLHRRHYQTLLTLHGESVTREREPMTAQLIVFGSSERDARPALALVDRHLVQWDIELVWPDAAALGFQLLAAAERFDGRMT